MKAARKHRRHTLAGFFTVLAILALSACWSGCCRFSTCQDIEVPANCARMTSEAGHRRQRTGDRPASVSRAWADPGPDHPPALRPQSRAQLLTAFPDHQDRSRPAWNFPAGSVLDIVERVEVAYVAIPDGCVMIDKEGVALKILAGSARRHPGYRRRSRRPR